MRLRSVFALLTSVALALALMVVSPRASAQPRAEAKETKAKKARPVRPSKGPRGQKAEKERDKDKDTEATEAADPTAAKAEGAGESGVKAAGTEAPAESTKTAKPVVKEAESAEGVKTYQFGAVEVEGRLRSPQILYFLRRVRAEFDASALGHRSFLRELADTRNDPAFR